jgi:hypothetical protein
MKNHYATGFLVVCLFVSTVALAQDPTHVKQHIPDKPLLFAALPDKFECTLPELEKASASRTTEKISLQFGKFVFTGEVTARVQRSENVQSINIRSTNYPGALFNISFPPVADNTKKISGRIIHPQSGDVLILSEENNRYFLRKQQQKYFMTE